MPNTFAYFMLVIWPFFSLYLFTRLSPLYATLWTVIGGYIILPEQTNFNFPLIPTLDKESISVLIALAGCYFIANQRVPLLPRSGPERWLIILGFISPFITALTNQDSFRGIPGMSLYDSVAWLMFYYIGVIPFLLGMHLVKTNEDQIKLFRWMVVAGLIYSLPALYEVRMSPQLHREVYGFFPHEWRQQIRFGGFRPVVFMRHGLVVSAFFTTALMAAIALWKDKQGLYGNSVHTKKFTLFAVAYLFTVLILCKSVASIIYSSAFLLAVICVPFSLTRIAAFFVITVVLTYPISSLTGIFPHEALVELARNINDLRAESLAFRFMNEDVLLTHAKEKLLFGWGMWGRNRPFSGVVTDGYWIIILGITGVIGFLVTFGLAAHCIFRGLRAGAMLKDSEGGKIIVFYSLLIALILVDQIVNSSISVWIWFLIGGLLGRANHIIQTQSFRGAEP